MAEKSYTFTIPDSVTGELKKVIIDGPASLTKKQAESVMRQQYNTLKDAKPGTNLADSAKAGFSLDSLTSGVKSVLGEAGTTIGDAISGVTNSLEGALTSTPTDTLSTADFVKVQGAVKGISKDLGAPEVTALMAQTSITLGKNLSDVSATNGIGKYGFQPQKLEESGFLKPGTVKKFLNFSEPAAITAADELKAEASGGTLTAQDAANARRIESVLGSPTIWSGKNGASKLSDIVGNEKLQTDMQQEMLTSGFAQMKSAGFITGNESPETLAALASVKGQASEEEFKKYMEGNLDPAIKAKFDNLASGGSFGASFAKCKLPTDLKKPELPPAFVDSCKRQSVEMQRAALTVSDRIQSYDFGGIGEPVEVTQADIDEAEKLNAKGVTTTPEEVASARNAKKVYGTLASGGLQSMLGDTQNLLGNPSDLLGSVQNGVGNDLLGVAEQFASDNMGAIQGISNSCTGSGTGGSGQNIFSFANGGNLTSDSGVATGGISFSSLFSSNTWQGAKPLDETVDTKLLKVNNDLTNQVRNLESKVDSGTKYSTINLTYFNLASSISSAKESFENWKGFALKQDPYDDFVVAACNQGISACKSLLLQMERIRLKGIDNDDRES